MKFFLESIIANHLENVWYYYSILDNSNSNTLIKYIEKIDLIRRISYIA